MTDCIIEIDGLSGNEDLLPPGLTAASAVQDKCYDPFTGRVQFKQIPNLPKNANSVLPPTAPTPELLTHAIDGRKINFLSNKFDSYYKELSADLITEHYQNGIVDHLKNRIQIIVPSAVFNVYGGAKNGLSSVSSDIDCTLRIEQNILSDLEFEASQYIKNNVDYINKQFGVCFQEYIHFVQQTAIAMMEANKYQSEGKIAQIDQNLLQKRDKWQKSVVLTYITSLFNQHEIADIITSARIPVLKLRLRFNTRSQQIISIDELKQIIEELGYKSLYQPVDYIKIVNIDMCLNNELPVLNTRLIENYMNCSQYVKELILIIKNWAKHRELTIASDLNRLNSYSLILLIIFYLQQIDVVPKLQPGKEMGPVVQGYDCSFQIATPNLMKSCHYNVGQLVMGFFNFYGYVFPWEHGIVSVRMGRTLARSEKQWYLNEGDFNKEFKLRDTQITIGYSAECTLSQQEAIFMLGSLKRIDFVEFEKPLSNIVNINCDLCIEDPLEYNVNVTRNVDWKNFKVITCEFRRAFSVIRRDKDPVTWLLLSPEIDPPGSIPDQGLKKLLDKQNEMKNVKVEFQIAEKPKVSYSLSLKATQE